MRNLAKFLVVGGVSTIINYLSFYSLYTVFTVNYLVSSTCGYVLGIAVGYHYNRLWTFKVSRSFSLSEGVKYFIVYLFSLVFGMLILFLFVDMFRLDPLIANVVMIIFTTISNYCACRFFVFK